MIIYKSIKLIESNDSYYGHDEEDVHIFERLEDCQLHCCNSFVSYVKDLFLSEEAHIVHVNANRHNNYYKNYKFVGLLTESELLVSINNINNFLIDKNYEAAIDLISKETISQVSFKVEQEELKDYLEEPLTFDSKYISDKIKQLVFDQ